MFRDLLAERLFVTSADMEGRSCSEADARKTLPLGKPLSIVLVANAYFPADQEGGPPFSNRELAEGLVRAGANVLVVTTNRNGQSRLDVPTNQWVNVAGVRVFYARVKLGAWGRAVNFRGAVRMALAQADVCIMSAIFWNYSGLVSWWECRRAGVPYVTYTRGLLSDWALRHKGVKKSAYWHLLGKRIVAGSSKIIALAKQEVEDIRRTRLSVPIEVIPNGAPRAEIADALGAVSSEVEAHSGVDYVLFLGRVHPKKGVDILIRAFETCVARGISARLVIAGAVDPEYASEFEGLLKGCHVRDRIDVVGTVTGARKSRLLKGASAFVLPSRGEGLPVAVLEAMSFGIPVIVSRGCNLPEVSAAGAGFEVALTHQAVADAMVKVLQDDQIHAACSERARALVAATFSWEASAGRVLALCREVAAPRVETTAP